MPTPIAVATEAMILAYSYIYIFARLINGVGIIDVTNKGAVLVVDYFFDDSIEAFTLKINGVGVIDFTNKGTAPVVH